MAGQSVGDRHKKVKEQIQAACLRAGRTPESVHLLAVSKLQSPTKIRQAHQSGQQDFAENYVQEAQEKMISLAECSLRWHFIGRIQSNKLKLLSGKFYAIHSVDRVSLIQPLNAWCASQQVVQNIFLQFNVANESSKGGAALKELENLITAAKGCAHLRTLGFMLMPPMTDDPEVTRPYFKMARQLLTEVHANLSEDEKLRHPFVELSMGTSQDFAVAIEEGATWVRIGSDIFGPRETEE